MRRRRDQGDGASARRAPFAEHAGRIRLAIALTAFVISASVFGLIAAQKIGFYIVPTSSMEPTLHPEDRIVALAGRSYSRGQVVVVRDPGNAGQYLVKRIVGMPGDEVEVRNGRLVVNGRIVSEPYLREPIAYLMPPTPVSRHEIFVLGDNRNESEDSHLWRRGVPISHIVGAVRYIYSPGARRGTRIAYPEVFQGVAHARNAQDAAGPVEPDPQ